MATSADITKLVGDPTRCRAYGLASDRIVVIDTAAKQEMLPILLEAPATDIDLARDGSVLVVSHRTAQKITVIDPTQGIVTRTIPVPVEPGPLEVTRAGTVFYATFDQFSYLHRVDVVTGTDIALSTRDIGYQVDLELSADETHLFAAESSSSSCDLVDYDVSQGAVKVAETTWNNRLGFSTAPRHLMESASRHLYFAHHQWSDHDLSKVSGGTDDDNILAEDEAGTLAIGTQHAWDVALSVPTIAHLEPVVAAAIVASGQEAWMATASGLRYVATADLVGPHPLGVHERTPAPLATYTIARAIFDPVRARIYALDASRHSLLAIDPGSLAVTREVVVGAAPSDLVLDREAPTLYVGHAEVDALALVDLADVTFERFVHTPRLPYEVEAAGAGRVIVADRYDDAAPTLFDVASTMSSPVTTRITYAALAVAEDGQTVYAGDTSTSGSDLFRFTVTSSNLALTNKTTTQPFFTSRRRIVIAPGGSRLFFGENAIASATFAAQYTTPGPVIAVSPDGRLALTRTRVIDVATGTDLGALNPNTASEIVVSADSQTAFLFVPGAIQRVALSNY